MFSLEIKFSGIAGVLSKEIIGSLSDWSISSIEIKSSGIKGVISKEVVESLIETL